MSPGASLSLELGSLLQGAPRGQQPPLTSHSAPPLLPWKPVTLAWCTGNSVYPTVETVVGGVRGRGSLEAEAYGSHFPQHYTKDKGAICTKLVKPKRKQGAKSAEEELAKGMAVTQERSSHTHQPRHNLSLPRLSLNRSSLSPCRGLVKP